MTSRGTAGAAALVLLLFQFARATAADETPAEPATRDAAAARATPDAGPTGVLCLRKLPPPIDFATERKGSSGPGDLVFQDTRPRQMATRPVLVVTVDDRAAVTVDQKNASPRRPVASRPAGRRRLRRAYGAPHAVLRPPDGARRFE